MKKKQIGCVIVLFNPDKKVVERIEQYPMNVSPIILIDNSTLNNASLFSNIIRDDVFYIALNNNTGIAHALNLGINKIKDKASYIITMDQDSELTNIVVDTYYEAISKMDNVKVLAPNFETERKKHKKKTGYDKVKLSMQSGMLFQSTVFDKVGMFNEELFLDVVDYEYCLRLRNCGIDILRCNEAILNHHPAETRERKFIYFSLKYGVASPIRYYYQARNLMWTAKKYKSFKMYQILIIKLFKILLLFDNKKKYLDYYFIGIKDANSNSLGKRDKVT
ncbi:glycosyltransferase [Eubacterium xylanophilum]|uniref:glycosyltransferase n=1 Tax=Eubacterium xylanophilum TaxID=39497 RepID=UPI000550D158|nr:glycosyltransferase [Eubacterium xylanophilum]